MRRAGACPWPPSSPRLPSSSLLLDLNAALILCLWVLRTIVLYVVIAFFITLLFTPATRFMKRRLHMSHGGAVLLVFLLGLIAFVGLVYLFAEPLVTSASHFGESIPNLIDEAKKGKGPIGKLVFRLHLQKYLSENSSKFASQITKVLKPATALSVGAAAASTVIALATIAVLTFFTMLEAPRMWQGFLGVFQRVDGRPAGPGGRRDDPLGHRLHAGELPDLDHRRGRGVRVPHHPGRALRRTPGHLRGPGRPVAPRGRVAGRRCRW